MQFVFLVVENWYLGNSSPGVSLIKFAMLEFPAYNPAAFSELPRIPMEAVHHSWSAGGENCSYATVAITAF